MEQIINDLLGWTTYNNAKKLVEAGLPRETADMWYDLMDGDEPEEKIAWVEVDRWAVENYEIYPCWSLGSLIKLLPDKILEDDELEIRSYLVEDGTRFYQIAYSKGGHDSLSTSERESLIEVCIEMILHLLINKTLTQFPSNPYKCEKN